MSEFNIDVAKLLEGGRSMARLCIELTLPMYGYIIIALEGGEGILY